MRPQHQQPFVRHYADERMLNQQQPANVQIHTWNLGDDRNRAAVMMRGPNTSPDYLQGLNFVPYQFGPADSRNSHARMMGYIADEPTWVNDRPVGTRYAPSPYARSRAPIPPINQPTLFRSSAV